MIDVGSKKIVGQEKVRAELSRIVESGRLGHAYLLAGPVGVGKKALALAFAEAINGVENLSELGSIKVSQKSSWFVHPDIHFFIPMPKSAPYEEFSGRIQLIAEDPYAVVDFGSRPSLDGSFEGKSRNAFYHKDYFKDEIRPKMMLKPNEGKRNIVIISNIEKMPPNIANAFLKTLEEPGENLMFILTTDNFNGLLPTIVSRCQILRCSSISNEQIFQALIENDGLERNDADYLARVSGGNYVSTRFYDAKSLRENRKQVIHYLRMAYTQDAAEISTLAAKWGSEFSNEGNIAMLNMIEVFLRDLAVYMDTQDERLLTNADQVDIIKKFTSSLQNARIEAMIATVNSFRPMIYQNIQSKLIYTVMAMRFGYLMRGLNTPIPDDEPWLHFPAITNL
jgi:DNA polymerase-3 subunit delta'